ncbi:MAG: MaoC family dehydratase N-terminal domain-containing protein [Acidobacteriia bacterium]|nr:MaoC family dehydratase N-terminal domain-containing protein [Terriglobia bacterium]
MFYDDFKIGDSFVTRGRTVTEADIVAFAGLSGDFNSLHVDAEYGKTTPFGQRIAHGLLVLSISSGLTVQTGLTSDSIIAFYGIDKLRFVKPVFIGDTLTVSNRVIELTPKEDPTRGLVVFETTVVKQSQEPVLVYHRRVLLRRKANS